MNFIYPAVFHKTKENTYEGYFPDLESCYAKGDTLDDALEDAFEAAYNWIALELEEDDCQLPSVTDESDMNLQEGDIVRNIMVHIRFHQGWDE
ncbi:MAG: type II toxin-antitoxin system HicB family antitoxin [Clostridia bacterium]|nr:type II toxin-antitoxin system HicB family antitoxin [Clostridia bacterium]NCC44526.1 type II toxin-antitoxin system HicB family antitoxin [Clostridia bacterium]